VSFHERTSIGSEYVFNSYIIFVGFPTLNFCLKADSHISCHTITVRLFNPILAKSRMLIVLKVIR